MVREGYAIVGVTARSGFQSLTADVEPRDCLGIARTHKSLKFSQRTSQQDPTPQPSVAEDQHGLVTGEENGEGMLGIRA